MAGDIGYDEHLVVLDQDADSATVEQVTTALDSAAGVVHQYGSRLLVVHDLAGASAPRSSVDGARVVAGPDQVGDDLAETLSEAEQLGLEAFSLRSSDDYAAAKAQRPYDGAGWENSYARVLPPDPPPAIRAELHEVDETRAQARAAASTSARLTGSVSVGIIIVEGPTSVLTFSPEERVKVVAEVQNGLGWLGAQSSPTGVRFVYDIRIVTLGTQPGADDLTSAQKEALWRDPAMASLGYGAGMGGVQDYVDELRSNNSTDWAYCAFFTKYPLGWFAYASIGGPRLVMDYANDGWGPDNIDRVFAHETGHVFGAPDEYASSGCNCGGSWGFFGKPNENCESSAPAGGVACLMRANTYAMCAWTPYHLGFPQGVRYSGAFTAGSGQYGLWVNADQTNFLDKWREWSGQGLRLRDLEVYRPGNTTLYGGVFEAGSGRYALWVNASWDSFRAKWEQWSGQGLRLTDIEVVRVGGSDRYSGVFAAGSGGYGLWANASWDSFRAKWEQWSGQGLRLTDLKVIDTSSGLRYSGVFAAGSGGHGLWANASWDSFRAKWEEWSGQGLRLVDVNVVNVGGAVRYFGVFRAGTGRYALWANADWPSFKAKWDEWSADGLRLIDLDVRPTGIEAAAAPTPADSDMAGLGFGGQPLMPAVAAGEPSEPGFGARAGAGPIDEPLAGFGAAVLDTTDGAAEAAGSSDGEGGRVLDDPDVATASSDGEVDGEGGVQLDGRPAHAEIVASSDTGVGGRSG